jgi:hypothetical protein
MKIEYYTESKEDEMFQVAFLPDVLLSISINYNKDKNNDGLGSVDICWNKENGESDSIFLRFNNITYLVINDKDKFVIKNRADLYELYKFLTKSDTELYLKQFKAFDKVQSIEGDFK